MKTPNLVLGIILIVGGLALGGYYTFAACSDSPQAQALFGVPACGSVLALIGVAVVMLVIGLAVLVAGRERRVPQLGKVPDAATRGPQSPPLVARKVPRKLAPTQNFCPSCGQWYPSDYKLCPRADTELKTVR